MRKLLQRNVAAYGSVSIKAGKPFAGCAVTNKNLTHRKA